MTTRRTEGGQTLIEFALIFSPLMLFITLVAGAGLAFYAYTGMAGAARYGARWAAVQGGICGMETLTSGQTDWCNQTGSATASGTSAPTANFWSLDGNRQLQPAGTSCPATGDDSTFVTNQYFYSDANTNAYTHVSYFTGNRSSSIVGAVLQRLDTSTVSNNVLVGKALPGIDTSQIEICIEETYPTSGFPAYPLAGDRIHVFVYYPFHFLVSAGWTQVNLRASGQFTIE